jgi:Glutathione S-transferase N-terminal domain
MSATPSRIAAPMLFVWNPMITLYSYPELFGVADNNGYGLKVFAFLRLNGMPFKHEHVFDASAAPRGQLPYIVDDGETIGDSDTIIAHVIAKNRLKIDAALTARQRDMSLLITRMIDDLYWVMSYSRWKDERFWPAFRDALLREHPSLTEAGLRKAQISTKWQAAGSSALHLFGRCPAAHAQAADQKPSKGTKFRGNHPPRRGVCDTMPSLQQSRDASGARRRLRRLGATSVVEIRACEGRQGSGAFFSGNRS